MAPPAGAPEGAGAVPGAKGGSEGGAGSTRLYLFVNGKEYNLVPGKDFTPEQTLLTWLRARGLTGTKLGCGEGGCGACTLSVSHFDTVSEAPSHQTARAAPIMRKNLAVYMYAQAWSAGSSFFKGRVRIARRAIINPCTPCPIRTT
jgi:hypothetical protein